MKKSKQKKVEQRLKRVKKVMDGKLDINKLSLKEMQLMYKVMEEISRQRALEEIKHLTPDQIH